MAWHPLKLYSRPTGAPLRAQTAPRISAAAQNMTNDLRAVASRGMMIITGMNLLGVLLVPGLRTRAVALTVVSATPISASDLIAVIGRQIVILSAHRGRLAPLGKLWPA